MQKPDRTEKDRYAPESLVRQEIRDLQAYHVPSARGLIKLDAMESPYGFPESLVEEWKETVGTARINRYPDPACTRLREIVRGCFQVPDACEIVFGNGSDELIQMIVMLVGGSGRPVLAPEPSFSMYRQICGPLGAEFVGVPLGEDYSLDGDRFLAAVRDRDPACIFLAYPNNPTGNCFDEDVLAEVLEAARGLVVIDEAYFAFCRKTFMNKVVGHDNLMVLRTMSKSGLAGLRLGMLFANRPWTSQIEKIRLPYNINCLTQLSMQFYLEHHEVLDRQARKIAASRETLYGTLQRIPGVAAFPSEANFILFRVQEAESVHAKLRDQGVLVKSLHQPQAALQDCLRVSVGSEAENEAFLKALVIALAG